MGNSFLQDYTLLGEAGKGGFATVYKVRHNELGYVRAVRVLNATIVRGAEDKTYQKFIEECRVLLRLGNGSHPNIVHIYQPLLRGQSALVEMDYVNGLDLSHYLESCDGFVEASEVIKLAEEIGSALSYCHEDIYKYCMDREEDDLQDDPEDGRKVLIDDATRERLIAKYRIIHNDIHSGNIMRNCDGRYVLLDFGLAIEGDEVIRSSRRNNGAPEFKAPEKWDSDTDLSTFSDIYSFGVVLYEMLAGRVPFPFDKNGGINAEYRLSIAHKEDAPEPIAELRKRAFEAKYPGRKYVKDYPDWLGELIMTCLEKNPKDRFSSGRALYDFVKEHNKSQPVMSQQEPRRKDDDRTVLDTDVTGLKSENADLKSKIGELESELEMNKAKAEEVMNALRVENADYKQQLEQARTCGGEVGVLKNENKELRRELKQLATRNLWTVTISVLILLATLSVFTFL